jgi:malonyl CoA-acyl carrier protein transacylase
MVLNLPAIVRRLQEVEARHPEVADELASVIETLASQNGAALNVEEARELLDAPSTRTIEYWLELGIMEGTRDDVTGRWIVSLAEVPKRRRWIEDMTAFGGDDLTQEELDMLHETSIGTFPWERGERC